MIKTHILACLLILSITNCFAQSKSPSSTKYHMAPIHMQSRWAKDIQLGNVLNEYPRPQLQRSSWENLNGLWEYAITDSSVTKPTFFEGNILVPFPIESALSGVQRKLMPDKALWYKRLIQYPKVKNDDRVLLNFGAIDWQSSIFINDKLVGQNTGGYQSFSIDITDFLKPGNNEILVKVYDPSDKGPNPHGKQVLNPENIYYTSSSGIWQTVWLEVLPKLHITKLKITPDIDRMLITLDIKTNLKPANSKFEITISTNGHIINKVYFVSDSTYGRKITIPNARLWSPDDPFLYDISIKLLADDNKSDEVTSYFGMRKIDIQKDEKGADRIYLNNKYTYNLGILDQGFWPEGLYTAPTDEALSFDIKAIKSLGFNTIRKHIKIEPERWYYHADRIGILVWQDFVNPPHDLPEGSRSHFEEEVAKTMEQLYNHPCIVTWVLFNERWGAYDQQRLTSWVKNNDTTRLVDGHSGELLYVNNQLRAPSSNPWVGSDMTDIHSYPDPRNAPPQANKARVIGEFGGIGVPVPGHEWDDLHGWGYMQTTPIELKTKYENMIHELKKLEQSGLSASIYTQPFDVEGEENGLFTYDREIIKIPASDLRSINRLLAPMTNNNIDSNFFLARNVNTSDNDDRYEEFIKQYENGNKDSAFLRRLALISIRKKDYQRTTTIGNEYFSIIKYPLSQDNIQFISKITRTSKDKGFKLFLEQHQKVDIVLGENFSINKIKSIIDMEEIAPFKENPDWKSILEQVSLKYGDLGRELVYGKMMQYYGFQSKIKDWTSYAKYYTLYFKSALTRPEYHINNFSYLICLHINDPKILSFAIGVMKYAIQKWDQSPEAYDTYAQLLHKNNNSKEAIIWEKKAVELKKGAPDEKEYAETLQKMKSGLPTWPQNN